ncbi:MAG: hypothetical protein MUE34_15580, partial [Acidimicrobiales bacterium]|nr:hypothetical protein [Acidimicrobiales bacterium]
RRFEEQAAGVRDRRRAMERVLVMGAGGRDFHDFTMALRDDPSLEVVAFTAAQIPGIDHRRFPSSLAGPRYPDGIPILPEAGLAATIRELAIDRVVLAYSDLSNADVGHLTATVLAAGADLSILGPRSTMVRSRRPVVAVCAVRTGCGKSPTSRRIGRLLRDAGLRVALVRHPMPYGDLEAMRVQRFASLADIDAAHPSVEEREEYEPSVHEGLVVWSGVDYRAILEQAEVEADVIVWDGGNDDLPFLVPDLHVTVLDARRPAACTDSPRGEANLRMADVLVCNKVDVASPAAVEATVASARACNPGAPLVRAASPVRIEEGVSLLGRRVLVVEDGPTITHGGLPDGAGAVAARAAGAELVDPRPGAVGSIAETYRRFPHIGPVLPAMGYGGPQLEDLAATIAASGADAVLNASPAHLDRLIDVGIPIRQVRYELEEVGHPDLADVLEPWIGRWTDERSTVAR